MYQKGDDSLTGRYLLFYLWPFTLAEVAENNIDLASFINNPIAIHSTTNNTRSIWEDLKQFSGFPDPFLNKSKQYYRILH